MVKNQGERWWNKVEQRHERSGIGSLVRPEDIYISPWELDDRLRSFSGFDLDQLGAVDVLDADRQPSPRSTSPPAPPCASMAAFPRWSRRSTRSCSRTRAC